MAIAAKESRETHYWLRLLKYGDYINKDDLINECEELIRLLTSIVKTSGKNNFPQGLQRSIIQH